MPVTAKYAKICIFLRGSVYAIPIKGEKNFDVGVCFEAIEHVENHNQLLAEVKRLLKDRGIFIVSSPNKETYTDKPKYNNPFHLKELYFDEFSRLLGQYFKNAQFMGHRVFDVSNIWSPAPQKDGCHEELVIDLDYQLEDPNFSDIPLNGKAVEDLFGMSVQLPDKEHCWDIWEEDNFYMSIYDRLPNWGIAFKR
jgi:SAM-dependent methyltransferase